MLGDNLQVADATLTGISLLECVNAEYGANGLRLPFVPDHLVPAMRQLNAERRFASDERLFASETTLPAPLDFVPAWLGAIRAPRNDDQKRLMNRDYLYFGEAGYGVNSRFYYYFLHLGSIYLFYAHPFGGAYQNNELAADRINADSAHIARAFAQLSTQPARRGSAVAVVADAKSNGYGWGTIADGQGGDWHDASLEEALRQLLADGSISPTSRVNETGPGRTQGP